MILMRLWSNLLHLWSISLLNLMFSLILRFPRKFLLNLIRLLYRMIFLVILLTWGMDYMSLQTISLSLLCLLMAFILVLSRVLHLITLPVLWPIIPALIMLLFVMVNIHLSSFTVMVLRIVAVVLLVLVLTSGIVAMAAIMTIAFLGGLIL